MVNVSVSDSYSAAQCYAIFQVKCKMLVFCIANSVLRHHLLSRVKRVMLTFALMHVFVHLNSAWGLHTSSSKHNCMHTLRSLQPHSSCLAHHSHGPVDHSSKLTQWSPALRPVLRSLRRNNVLKAPPCVQHVVNSTVHHPQLFPRSLGPVKHAVLLCACSERLSK